MKDSLKKYLSTDRSTRIQTLQLDQSWRTGLAHQHLPDPVITLLGELAAASALLAGNIKFDGSVVLQLQGNGPVQLIMVECTGQLNLRATAHLRESATIPADGTLQALLNPDGRGRFTVLLDPDSRQEGGQPYQGIVPLTGDSVAAVLEHYMRHSEQLDTRLWLAADAQRCAGMLLQRMPDDESPASWAGTGDDTSEEPAWQRLLTLADTLQPEELLGKDSETLIHQLFWENDLLAFPAQAIRWHCPCTRQRVADMLRSLGREEIDAILAEQDHVHVDCNFCGKPYDFDAVDCAALFIDTDVQPGDPSTLH